MVAHTLWMASLASAQRDAGSQPLLALAADSVVDQRLLEEYPASAYAPAALYKGRACLLALGRPREAWEMGGRLLDEHPQAPEAALLREETAGN